MRKTLGAMLGSALRGPRRWIPGADRGPERLNFLHTGTQGPEFDENRCATSAEAYGEADERAWQRSNRLAPTPHDRLLRENKRGSSNSKP